MDDAETPAGNEPPDPPAGGPSVSLADAAVAAAIGRAAAQGRGPDRAPTLEQLLAAFGEGEATTAARDRVAAALALAGVDVEPGVRTAAPGQRLVLTTPGMASPSRRSPALTAVYALGALAVILGTAFAVSQLVGDGGERASVITDTTFAIETPTSTTSTTTKTESAATSTTDAATESTGAPTETATTTTTKAAPTATERAAAKRKRQRALAKMPIVVRLEAPAGGTFLCADDGKGNSLFNGTLVGRKTFKGRRVRLNVGLATTRITVNGEPLAITGSPAGFDITRSAVKPLPQGQRPCA